jgi:hypothetical protein
MFPIRFRTYNRAGIAALQHLVGSFCCYSDSWRPKLPKELS